MKDHQLQFQTPTKDLQHTNRRSKSISDQTKKSMKSNKKCLDSLSKSVSEDVSLDSTEFSSISEISEDHIIGNSAVSLITSLDPVLLPSLETVATSDLTPSWSTVTVDKYDADDVSVGNSRPAESRISVDIASVEAEMVVNHLRQARFRVLNSNDVDIHSKKLLYALIEVVIEEFNALPEERELFAELVSTKIRAVLVCFLLGILAVLLVFIFESGAPSSFSDPPPT